MLLFYSQESLLGGNSITTDGDNEDGLENLSSYFLLNLSQEAVTVAYIEWWTTLLSPPVDPPPHQASKIRAFIGRRYVVRYVKWMKGSPQRWGGRQGKDGCLKIEDGRKRKGRLSIDPWMNDSGMEQGEAERWPPSPPTPPQASSPQPGCRGTRRRGWQRAARSTESVRASASAVHTSSCSLVIFSDDAVWKNKLIKNLAAT